MEQLIIFDKDGNTYSTYQDYGSELTSQKRFKIMLKSGKKIILKRRQVWQYWLKNYDDDAIISIDNNGLVRMYSAADDDAQDLFNKFFKRSIGRIEPLEIQESHDVYISK